MANFIFNSKKESNVVCFYIPENKKDHKIVTRVFLTEASVLVDELEKLLKRSNAEYAIESGSEFLTKLKNAEQDITGYQHLNKTVAIKFDFNDIGLIYNLLRSHLDEACDKSVKHLVQNEAMIASSKRFSSLYSEQFKQQTIRWYQELNLPPSIPQQEVDVLFKLHHTLAFAKISNDEQFNPTEIQAKLDAQISRISRQYSGNISNINAFSKTNVGNT